MIKHNTLAYAIDPFLFHNAKLDFYVKKMSASALILYQYYFVSSFSFLRR